MSGEYPSPPSPMRSRRRVTGQVAGHRHSPATRCCRRRTATGSTTAPAPRLHGERRPLPQRDEPLRRRHPAAPVPAGAQPLRPRLLPASGAQRRQLVGAGLVETDPPEEGDPRPARARSPGRAPTPIRRSSTTCCSTDARVATRHEAERRRRARARCSRRRRAVDQILDVMVRTGPYGDNFGDDPDGLTLRDASDNPHGVDFGPWTPRVPDILRTPSGAIELAPPELAGRPTHHRQRSDGDADDHDERRRSCSSVVGICAPTTRGCTTSTCW